MASRNRLHTVTYPNGQTSAYTYLDDEHDHRLQTNHHKYPNASMLSRFDYTYDGVGNILTWRQQADSTAVLWKYGYDQADQLTAAVKHATDTPQTVLKRYAYAYDPAGHRTVEQIDDAVTLSAYDNLNRLTSQAPGGPMVIAGSLNEPGTVTISGMPAVVDGNNNFRGTVPTTSGVNTFTIVAKDASGNTTTNTYEIAQSGSSKTFTYDANGNLTSDGTRTFEWDAANRLVKVVEQQTTLAEYGYDGYGQRSLKIAGGTVRRYVLDAEHVTEERIDGQAQHTRYVRGPGVDVWLGMQTSSGSAVYFVADLLASVRAHTDSNGAVLLRRDYDPFGIPDSSSAAVSGPAFTGRDWDSETNLYQFRARYYAADIGRFLSNDPIGFEGGTNFYKYSDGNPISVIDPSGLGPIRIITLCAKGYNVVKTVGFKQAVQAVLRGEDVLASSSKEAKRISKAASRAKNPIRDTPHKPGYMRHFHPQPRTGAHVFYELAAAMTFVRYARCENCTEATLATVADFFNPLATPNDLLELISMVGQK